MHAIRNFFQQIKRYPSAVAGLIIVSGLIITSIVVPIVIPYSEAVRLWRGGDDIWAEFPRNAWPTWYNWFVEGTLPETIRFSTAEGDGEQTSEQLSADTREINHTFTFDYPYDDFPPEINIFAKATLAIA